jgi:hypothetical protein
MSCTLKSFADETSLPIETLTAHGAAECRRLNTRAVDFPCLDERGEIVGGTACLAPPTINHGGRWDRSQSPPMFGLETLPAGRSHGEIVLTENEIEALILHHHGVAAVAVTGPTSEADWTDHLTDVDRVFILPSSSVAVPEFVANIPAPLCDALLLIRATEHPSIRALHADPECDWQPAWASMVAGVVPWREHDATERAIARAEARTKCEELVTSPDILAKFAEALTASGFAGLTAMAQLLFLIVISRFLNRPVSAAVKGPSSAGKSFLVKSVLRFLPDDAFHAVTAMTEKALIYDQEPLKHRVLLIQEAVGLGTTANLIVRSLLSEGRIDYKTVMSVNGVLQTVRIVREGPTSLITTTPRVLLHRENETRVVSLTVADTPEQTREVMQAIARGEGGDFDFAPWHNLQVFLSKGDTRVVVPYADVLADATEVVAVRMRRDFSNVVGLVHTHVLLHQESRERDETGRLIATFEDYGAVRGLLEDILSDGLEQTVAPQIKDVVAAVDLLHVPNDDGDGVTIRALATHLKLDRSTVNRQVAVALEREFLRDIGGRGRGRTKMLVPGEPLPAGTGSILPTVETLRYLCTYADTLPLDTPLGQPSLLDDESASDPGGVDVDATPSVDDEETPF